MNDFLSLAKERYSCRKISGREVEQEKIDKIIEAGRVAPTAVNRQPFRIWVMRSEEAKKAVHDVTGYTFGAELFFLVGASREEAWVRDADQANFADVDGAIVATHMMMEIQDLGLSTTWVGHFDAPKLQGIYPEMKNYDLLAIFPVGYAAEGARPAHLHSEFRDKSETVKVI